MSRDFTTKPRPDQPGRCPSIDPHDTLQCTRSIHDDDQCQAGGIAWRKGSPRIESDRERADRLQEDVEEYDATLGRQGDLLTRTVAEVARLTAELAEVKRTYTPCDLDLLTERDALAAQVARVEALAGQWARLAGTAINPNSREWLQACAATLRQCLSGWQKMHAALADSEADTSGQERCPTCAKTRDDLTPGPHAEGWGHCPESFHFRNISTDQEADRG